MKFIPPYLDCDIPSTDKPSLWPCSGHRQGQYMLWQWWTSPFSDYRHPPLCDLCWCVYCSLFLSLIFARSRYHSAFPTLKSPRPEQAWFPWLSWLTQQMPKSLISLQSYSVHLLCFHQLNTLASFMTTGVILKVFGYSQNQTLTFPHDNRSWAVMRHSFNGLFLWASTSCNFPAKFSAILRWLFPELGFELHTGWSPWPPLLSPISGLYSAAKRTTEREELQETFPCPSKTIQLPVCLGHLLSSNP